jgi:probable rRNA maturation factor
MPEIINQQTKIKIDCKSLEEFAERLNLQVNETQGYSFNIAFITDTKMRGLNAAFRGKDSTTDVLSFPRGAEGFDLDENIGDIAISVEQAKKQAEENNLSLEIELKQLILHGVLHLCGYDHETDNGEMNSRELELRDKIGI